MNTHEGMSRASVSEGIAEEIQDFDNLALRGMFEKAGLVAPGDEISANDYEATRSRAVVLAKESGTTVSPESLLIAAFVDRMRLVGQLGDAVIKQIPDEALRSIVFVDTGYRPTDEELALLRQSPLSLEQWEQGRTAAKGSVNAFDVAVDGDSVVAHGASPEDALRRGQEVREQQ